MIKFFLLLFIMFSCSIPKEVSDISYLVIYKSEMGGIDTPGHVLIQDNESYIHFIETLKLDVTQFAKFLGVDFKKKNILVLYQGQKNTGGYQIDIESLKNEKNTIIIKKKEIKPKKGEMTTSVITSPYCVVVIPKGEKLIIQ